MTAYIAAGYILQIVGAIALCYIIARLSINARIICNRKRRSVRHGVSSRESVIETMEEKGWKRNE